MTTSAERRAIDCAAATRRYSKRRAVSVTRAEGVVGELLKRDPDLSDLEVHGAGLEEAFLALTNPSTGEERAA